MLKLIKVKIIKFTQNIKSTLLLKLNGSKDPDDLLLLIQMLIK